MLSFQITNSSRTIQVDFDDDGLSELIAALEELRVGNAGHVHLRSPSAGGSVLGDKTPWGETAVSEVILTLG